MRYYFEMMGRVNFKFFHPEDLRYPFKVVSQLKISFPIVWSSGALAEGAYKATFLSFSI